MSEIKVCPTCGSEYPVSERFCPRDGSALLGQNAEGDLVGTVIADRYHVMKKLGEGGMGAVYLAEHLKMGRKSAIKVMNPGMKSDADAIARFNREASNAARMNHPNICAIYDFGETPDGLIYLAMEFIEGQSLTSLIEEHGALPPARAASILHQAADGLQVAHDYGIVHRDLKPDNIMIAKGRDNTDLVKVVDFGIAKGSDAQQKVTKTGLVVGTPEYMSPEQLAGDKLDGRSDIYSLALVGFNMLTGTLPFQSASAQEAMIMRLTDNPRSLAEVRPDVAWPDDLQAVMDKALARDAKARYSKAADFGRDFHTAIENMPATAATEAGTMVIGAQSAPASAPTAAIPRTRVASGEERKGSASAPQQPSAPPPAPTPVAKGGNGMMIGVTAGVVLALAVGGLWIGGVIGSKKDATPASQTASVPNAGGNGGIAKQTDSVKPQPTPPNTQTNQGNPTKAPPPKSGGTSAPPTGGSGGTTGTQPPANAALTPEELQDFKTLADPEGIEKDVDRANRAISRADELLKKATGGDKGEVLYRRGLVLIGIGQPASGCRNLTEAKPLLESPRIKQVVNTFFDSDAGGVCAK